MQENMNAYISATATSFTRYIRGRTFVHLSYIPNLRECAAGRLAAARRRLEEAGSEQVLRILRGTDGSAKVAVVGVATTPRTPKAKAGEKGCNCFAAPRGVQRDCAELQPKLPVTQGRTVWHRLCDGVVGLDRIAQAFSEWMCVCNSMGASQQRAEQQRAEWVRALELSERNGYSLAVKRSRLSAAVHSLQRLSYARIARSEKRLQRNRALQVP
jgi:hypothetical protein